MLGDVAGAPGMSALFLGLSGLIRKTRADLCVINGENAQLIIKTGCFFSYTYKKKVTQILSKEWLTSDNHVLILDDFMANGEAVRGLCELVEQAGAELVGVGIAIEKGFQGGGDRLRNMGVNYHALAVIEKADENGIIFRED